MLVGWGLTLSKLTSEKKKNYPPAKVLETENNPETQRVMRKKKI